MVQTMKFLIVETSPLPILIPLGPKYSPQDPELNMLNKRLKNLCRFFLKYKRLYSRHPGSQATHDLHQTDYNSVQSMYGKVLEKINTYAKLQTKFK